MSLSESSFTLLQIPIPALSMRKIAMISTGYTIADSTVAEPFDLRKIISIEIVQNIGYEAADSLPENQTHGYGYGNEYCHLNQLHSAAFGVQETVQFAFKIIKSHISPFTSA